MSGSNKQMIPGKANNGLQRDGCAPVVRSASLFIRNTSRCKREVCAVSTFFFSSFTHLFPRTRCWRMAAACFNWTVFVNCRLYLKNRRPRRYAGYTGTVNASRKTIPKGKTPYPEYDDDMAELASYVALTPRTNPPESTRRGPTVSCCCVVGRLAFAVRTPMCA